MRATPSPTAVVTSASAMPADTVPMPPPPLVGSGSFWKAGVMAPAVPNRPTHGERALLSPFHGAVDHLGDLDRRGGRARPVDAAGVLGQAGADHVRDRAAREALVQADRVAPPAGVLDPPRERRDVEARLPAPAPERPQPIPRDGQRI